MSQMITTPLPGLARPVARSLRISFAWAMTGQVAYAGSQWAILILLAKLGTPAMVGQFALGFAIAAPVFMFANLQLRAMIATDANGDFELSDYRDLQLVMIGLGLLATVLIVSAVHYQRETAAVVLILACAKSVECISELCYGVLQRHERLDRLGKALLLKAAYSLTAVAAGLWLTGTVVGAVTGLLVAWSVVLVAVDIRLARAVLNAACRRESPCTPKNSMWVRLLWLTLPLGCANMLISLNANIPRYIIERWRGEVELGLFSAMAYLTLAGNIVVQALGNSANARLARYYASGDTAGFWALQLRLLAIAALLGTAGTAAAAVAGKSILTILYRAEYATRPDVLVALMLAAGLGHVVQVLVYGMTAARRLRVQLPLFAAGGIVLAGLGMLLIPHYGLAGGATAMVATNALLAAGSVALVARAMKTTSGQLHSRE